jgi:enoyl-[acyl-carrier protein] reductase I
MTCDLKGKKGLIAGVANADSIAYGCVRAAHAAGAELLVAYGHPKAEPHVRPLLAEIGHPPAVLCDVTDETQMQALFEQARTLWGKLDFLVHSIAFAPKEDLHGRLIDCSSAGFHTAMEVSCFSFIRMAKLAEPLMRDGGCLLTMSYLGAEKVVENYNLMGPVKAALESAVRYLANELGPQGIRVHALSPGPLRTRAASGIAEFDKLMERAAQRSPMKRLVSIDDVGATAAFLASDAASALTGLTLYVDAGYQIMG